MAIETGLSWKVWLDTNENPSSPSWDDLPQQKGGTLEFSTTDADATNKDNSGWADSITTSRSWTVTCDGLADPDDTCYLYLVDTVGFGATTDHRVNLKMENADGDTYIGWAKVDNFSISFGYDEVVNYSVSFSGRGEPTSTRA